MPLLWQGHVSFAAVHGKEPGDSVQHRGITQPLWPVHCVQVPRNAHYVKTAGLHKSKLAGGRTVPGSPQELLYSLTTILIAQATSSVVLKPLYACSQVPKFL